jgi:hypothetical protein
MLFVAQPSQLRSGTKILDLGAKLQKVKFWKGKNLILIELQGYFQKYIYIFEENIVAWWFRPPPFWPFGDGSQIGPGVPGNLHWQKWGWHEPKFGPKGWLEPPLYIFLLFL